MRMHTQIIKIAPKEKKKTIPNYIHYSSLVCNADIYVNPDKFDSEPFSERNRIRITI